jgi:sulfoxide reductase heme-binding subunit YedZ
MNNMTSKVEPRTEHRVVEKVLGKVVIIELLGAVVFAGTWALFALTPFADLIAGALAAAGEKTAWYASRATAIVAYLLLSGSVVWGLILTTKIIKEVTPPPVVLALHNAISWAAITLGVLHAAALLWDTYYTYTILDLVLPFIGPYRPGWVGLGTVGLYLMVLTSVTFAWRSWLGQRNWKLIHYLTFPAYAFVTLHGLKAGTDSSEIGTQILYSGSALLVLFLINYRLLAARQRLRRTSRAVDTE